MGRALTPKHVRDRRKFVYQLSTWQKEHDFPYVWREALPGGEGAAAAARTLQLGRCKGGMPSGAGAGA